MYTIYSKPNCPQCQSTEEAFKNKNIKYQKIDITKDEEHRQKAVATGMRSMPIVISPEGNPLWCGFRPDELIKLEN